MATAKSKVKAKAKAMKTKNTVSHLVPALKLVISDVKLSKPLYWRLVENGQPQAHPRQRLTLPVR